MEKFVKRYLLSFYSEGYQLTLHHQFPNTKGVNSCKKRVCLGLSDRSGLGFTVDSMNQQVSELASQNIGSRGVLKSSESWHRTSQRDYSCSSTLFIWGAVLWLRALVFKSWVSALLKALNFLRSLRRLAFQILRQLRTILKQGSDFYPEI